MPAYKHDRHSRRVEAMVAKTVGDPAVEYEVEPLDMDGELCLLLATAYIATLRCYAVTHSLSNTSVLHVPPQLNC